jgi:hypothetical protein
MLSKIFAKTILGTKIFCKNKNFQENKNFHEIFRKSENFFKTKFRESELIFAFRENEKRGFRFNPTSKE